MIKVNPCSGLISPLDGDTVLSAKLGVQDPSKGRAVLGQQSPTRLKEHVFQTLESKEGLS